MQLAVELARLIEAKLERVLNGGMTPDKGDLETLLRLADLLDGISGAVGSEYSAWLSANADVLQRASASLRTVEKPLDSISPSPAVDSAISERSEPPPPVSPPEKAEKPKRREAKPVEQVVRVTARSLTRLMGLAGESLVEARWLQPFSKSLLELKRRQSLLADTLEELRQSLPPDDTDSRQNALLADAGDQLDECRRMLADQIGEFENRARNADDLNSRLYHEVIASRMRPFWEGVRGFPRMVRDLARQLDKKVTFRIHGEKTDVDRDILEKLEAPLNHILRNALDHGLEEPSERKAAEKPESCRLEMEARHNAGMLVITVSDDGRGIDLEKIREKVIQRKLADEQIVRELGDAELLEFLFLPAFSTTDGVTEVSGRGVGLDVVHSMIHSVGGSVRVQSQPGQGTTFQLEMPITLSVIRAVLVKIAGEPYAFPHNRIDRLVRLSRNDLHSLENRQHFEVDGRNVGVVLASQILDMEASSADNDELFAILFSHHLDQYGLIVDEFCGERDLVVRPLDPRLGKVPNINAAAILDDGSPVLIVDLDDMRRSIERKLHGDSIGRAGDRGIGTPLRRRSGSWSSTIRSRFARSSGNSWSTRDMQSKSPVDGMEGWDLLCGNRSIW